MREVTPLEDVVGWFDALEAEIDFELAAMMGGVGEVCPQPFEACHLAVCGSDYGVEFFRRHAGDCLIAEVEGAGEELEDAVLVWRLLSVFFFNECGGNIGTLGVAGKCAGAEVRTPYLDEDLTEGEFVGDGFEAVAVSGHQLGDADGEVAGGLPVFYECVFDRGLRDRGLREGWHGEEREECDANL